MNFERGKFFLYSNDGLDNLPQNEKKIAWKIRIISIKNMLYFSDLWLDHRCADVDVFVGVAGDKYKKRQIDTAKIAF